MPAITVLNKTSVLHNASEMRERHDECIRSNPWTIAIRGSPGGPRITGLTDERHRAGPARTEPNGFITARA
ncbi:hypothetical protein DPMN_104071 [Dreissena polymorpha]|uniref:Uncharacterized protein n=1 Tax=Dreissena polymorpha TaxID=45954 RepID=A0A9D4HCA8_DREPO|nr:hypothetical protein DPMN_104071 [Dreissena polymorpha]